MIKTHTFDCHYLLTKMNQRTQEQYVQLKTVCHDGDTRFNNKLKLQ